MLLAVFFMRLQSVLRQIPLPRLLFLSQSLFFRAAAVGDTADHSMDSANCVQRDLENADSEMDHSKAAVQEIEEDQQDEGHRHQPRNGGDSEYTVEYGGEGSVPQILACLTASAAGRLPQDGEQGKYVVNPNRV